MHLESVLPYGFIVGIVGAFIAALRWGKQDSLDSVNMAKTLRDQAVEDADQLRLDRERLEQRVRDLETQVTIRDSRIERLERQARDRGEEPVA